MAAKFLVLLLLSVVCCVSGNGNVGCEYDGQDYSNLNNGNDYIVYLEYGANSTIAYVFLHAVEA